MTVKELREKLAEMPDAAEIVAIDKGDTSVGIPEAFYEIADAHHLRQNDEGEATSICILDLTY